MADSLKLKYILSLISDVGPKARADQEALTRAQQAVQREVSKTNRELSATEKVMQQMGRTGSAAADRMAGYLARLARGYTDVRLQAQAAATAMAKAAAQGALFAAGKAPQIAAGGAAGLFAADRATRAPMDYSLRLAQMANTAFADRYAAGRIAGKQTLDAAIRAAIRTGGGSKVDAAGALDALIASGAVSIQDSIALLPTLMRGSSASGATAEQLGSIALRGMQSFGIQRGQVPEVLNMAMAAGQAGGFELKDMAKWLPQAMAAGRQSGLSGMEGMRRLLASMQASVITAGTKDEAGNNLVNLLAKINSNDTAKDFKKLGYDLPGELARMRGKGVNSLDAFVSFVDEIASKDKEYVALKKKLEAGGTTGEKAATMASMADILQGKAVGQVVQDRQALMALVAELNNRKYVRDVMAQTRTNTGAMSTSFDVIAQEGTFKKQQAENEVSLAGDTAWSRVAPAFGKAADTATDLAREFPLLTTSVVGATAALGVLAAMAGAGGLAGLLRGGVAGAGGAAGAAAGSTGAAAAGAAGATAASRLAGVGRFAGRVFGPLGAVLGAAMFTSDAELEVLRQADLMRQGSRGKGYQDPRLLSLTSPSAGTAGDAASTAAAIARVGMGEGLLRIEVASKDGTPAAATVVTQPPRIKLDVGGTNPAGYPGGR